MTALPILCVSLEEAKTMLAGKDPRDFGVQPVSGSGRGMVFYIPAIRQRLDELAGSLAGFPCSPVRGRRRASSPP